MCRTFVILCCVLASACASSRSEKIPFSELYPPAPEGVPTGPELPAADKKAQQQKRTRVAKIRSKRLKAAIGTFVSRSRQYRAGGKGQPFPAQAMKNWLAALDAVETFVMGPTTKASVADARMVQQILEWELELDVRTYAGFPQALGQSANERLGQLALLAAEAQEPDEGTQVAQESGYQWPVHPVAVTSLFGRRLHPIHGAYRVHFGVDLKAANGQPVTAAADGRVVRAAWNGGHGNQVEILHPGGVVTRYSHLAQLSVRIGLTVRQGDMVGAAGNTGHATGPHLHFEFWRRGRACDPVEELSQRARADRVASLR